MNSCVIVITFPTTFFYSIIIFLSLSSYLFSGLITIGVQKGYKDFRIDTHPENERMKGLSEKFGFEKRGIIYVDEKIEPIRYAYELNL